MILRPHRQPLVGGIEARAFGDRPAQQDAVQLQPEVVMKARGVVLLDEVREFLFANLDPPRLGFGGLVEIALSLYSSSAMSSPAIAADNRQDLSIWQHARVHRAAPNIGCAARSRGLRFLPFLPVANGGRRHLPDRRPQPFAGAAVQVSGDSRRPWRAQMDIRRLPGHGVKQSVLLL